MKVTPFPTIEQGAQRAKNVGGRTEEGHNFDSLCSPHERTAKIFQWRSLPVLAISVHDLGSTSKEALQYRLLQTYLYYCLDYRLGISLTCADLTNQPFDSEVIRPYLLDKFVLDVVAARWLLLCWVHS